MKIETWLWYVVLAGLSWGMYVPLIFYGGSELEGQKPADSRLMAILCVGIAYLVIAVAVPVACYVSGANSLPKMTATGLSFSGLAGVAGAIGALCVVFATQSAVASARGAGLPPNAFKVYIAPLIFSMAPVINVLVSLLWHPEKNSPWHFGLEQMPGWKLLAGMVLVGAGAFLVLMAKEETEAAPKPPSAVTQLP
jgi:hypothetical protein